MGRGRADGEGKARIGAATPPGLTCPRMGNVTTVGGPSAGQSGQNDGQRGRAREAIRKASNVLVLTGAGISTDSRIPDFRGPQGVWTKDPNAERMSNIAYYRSDVEVRRLAWRARLDSPVWAADPNPGHRALLRLEQAHKLNLLVTQNIDGLHHAAGSDPELIVEIHGTGRDVQCLHCSYRAPMQDALDRVRAGEDDPACPDCGGILKSATVSFGQSLNTADLGRAEQAAIDCDLLLAIGSTLGVYPIANVVPVAKSSGATIVIVNGSPTEMDDLADVIVRGSISEVLSEILL